MPNTELKDTCDIEPKEPIIEPPPKIAPPPLAAAVVADIMSLIKKHAEVAPKKLSDLDERVFFNHDWKSSTPNSGTKGLKDVSHNPLLSSTTDLTKPWNSMTVREVEITNSYDKLHKLSKSIPVLSNSERDLLMKDDGSLITDMRTLNKAKLGRPKSVPYASRTNNKWSSNTHAVQRVLQSLQAQNLPITFKSSPNALQNIEKLKSDKMAQIPVDLMKSTSKDVTDLITTIEYYNEPPVYRFEPDLYENLENEQKQNSVGTKNVEKISQTNNQSQVFEEKKFEEFYSKVIRADPSDPRFLIPSIPKLRKSKRTITPKPPTDLHWPRSDSKRTKLKNTRKSPKSPQNGGSGESRVKFQLKASKKLSFTKVDLDSSDDDDDEPGLSELKRLKIEINFR